MIANCQTNCQWANFSSEQLTQTEQPLAGHSTNVLNSVYCLVHVPEVSIYGSQASIWLAVDGSSQASTELEGIWEEYTMPTSREAFRQWVEQNTPPSAEAVRRWWVEIKASVARQTLAPMQLGRQAWAAEQERDAEIRRQRVGLGSRTRREKQDSDWLGRFDSLDDPVAV